MCINMSFCRLQRGGQQLNRVANHFHYQGNVIFFHMPSLSSAFFCSYKCRKKFDDCKYRAIFRNEHHFALLVMRMVDLISIGLKTLYQFTQQHWQFEMFYSSCTSDIYVFLLIVRDMADLLRERYNKEEDIFAEIQFSAQLFAIDRAVLVYYCQEQRHLSN